MPNSVGGMASGLNTSDIINSLLAAEQANRTRLQTRQGSYQKQLTVWQDLSTKLTALKVATEPFSLTNRSTSAATTTATSSDDKLVLAKAGSTAPTANFTFRVKQLAASHQVIANGFTETTDPVGEGKAIVAAGLTTVGMTLVDTTNTAAGKYDIEVKAINGGTATVVFGGNEQTVASSGAVTLIDGAGNWTSVAIGTLRLGKASLGVVQTTGSSTLGELASLINNVGVGVSAAAINKKDGSASPTSLVLSAREAGTEHALTVDFAALGAVAGKTFDTLRAASDAQIVLADGVTTVTRSSNRITDLMPGVTLDLRTADAAKDVTVTVAQDDQKVVDAGKAVLDALNTLLVAIKKNTAFDAGARKAAAMSGDSRLRRVSDSVMASMRYSDSGQDKQVLAQIGLSLGRDGTYSLNETTFRNALSSDHAGTMRLLAGDGAARKGVFGTLTETAKGLLDNNGTVDGAIDATRSTIGSFTSRIEAEDERLSLVEKRIRRQYTNLETSMAQLTSQARGLNNALR